MSGAFVILQWRPWEVPDGAVAVEKICPVRSIVDNIEVRAVDAMNGAQDSSCILVYTICNCLSIVFKYGITAIFEDDKRCRTVCFYVAISYDKIQCL